MIGRIPLLDERGIATRGRAYGAASHGRTDERSLPRVKYDYSDVQRASTLVMKPAGGLPAPLQSAWWKARDNKEVDTLKLLLCLRVSGQLAFALGAAAART